MCRLVSVMVPDKAVWHHVIVCRYVAVMKLVMWTNIECANWVSLSRGRFKANTVSTLFVKQCIFRDAVFLTMHPRVSNELVSQCCVVNQLTFLHIICSNVCTIICLGLIQLNSLCAHVMPTQVFLPFSPRAACADRTLQSAHIYRQQHTLHHFGPIQNRILMIAFVCVWVYVIASQQVRYDSVVWLLWCPMSQRSPSLTGSVITRWYVFARVDDSRIHISYEYLLFLHLGL